MKIWFQNRRAKERKQVKKREELIHKDKIEVAGIAVHPGHVAAMSGKEIKLSNTLQCQRKFQKLVCNDKALSYANGKSEAIKCDFLSTIIHLFM